MKDTAVQKKALKKQALMFAVSVAITAVLIGVCCSLRASAAPAISIDLGTGTADGSNFGTLELLFLLALLALAPSILIMMTSFTRIIIVLSFLRNALGTQQSPPNQVLIGLAFFLTLFIMMPTLTQINDEAYQPYKEGRIDGDTAVERMVVPVKEFMLRQTQKKDLSLFLSLSGQEAALESAGGEELESLTKLGLEVLVPAFVTSELKQAFTMGFLLFIPFLIIDMVVSSTLMSMGMVMLPPSMIALPFKIMMFVLVDGWNLLLGTLAQSFLK